MTFMDALYTGKRFIRCPYSAFTRTGWCVFDTNNDVIADITGLYESEFTSNNWEAYTEEEMEDCQ